MEYSNIFLSMSNFLDLKNKFVQENNNEKNTKKIKILMKIKQVFYFEDYLETNKKNKSFKKKIFFKIEFIYYFFYFFH